MLLGVSSQEKAPRHLQRSVAVPLLRCRGTRDSNLGHRYQLFRLTTLPAAPGYIESSLKVHEES